MLRHRGVLGSCIASDVRSGRPRSQPTGMNRPRLRLVGQGRLRGAAATAVHRPVAARMRLRMVPSPQAVGSASNRVAKGFACSKLRWRPSEVATVGEFRLKFPKPRT